VTRTLADKYSLLAAVRRAFLTVLLVLTWGAVCFFVTLGLLLTE
jgi:hypothetical protein